MPGLTAGMVDKYDGFAVPSMEGRARARPDSPLSWG